VGTRGRVSASCDPLSGRRRQKTTGWRRKLSVNLEKAKSKILWQTWIFTASAMPSTASCVSVSKSCWLSETWTRAARPLRRAPLCCIQGMQPMAVDGSR
jgi:hypothetical protein